MGPRTPLASSQVSWVLSVFVGFLGSKTSKNQNAGLLMLVTIVVQTMGRVSTTATVTRTRRYICERQHTRSDTLLKIVWLAICFRVFG